MLEIEAALAGVRTAWLAGRSALDSAPPAWRDAIGADELALLALAGHATDVLTRKALSAPLIERPLLPALERPLLPPSLRHRFRRLLATPKNTVSLERPLIAFVAARGYAAHPADWMLDANDEWAPDTYAPWLDWVRAEARKAPSDSEITADTYEQWSWTERREALRRLRARDPGAARAIIAAKAGGEPAERRVRLVELLQHQLSEADVDYLESLAKDRSDRVQALSRAFLARLGRGGDVSALAGELAEMVSLEKVGLIKRRTQLVLKPLKTSPQTQRRLELLRLVSLAALAQALGGTELQLVESPPDGAYQEVMAFLSCVADTGSNEAVRAMAESLLGNADTPAAFLISLVPRLSLEERRAFLPRVLKQDVDMFEATLSVAGPSLGACSLSAVTATGNFETLRANVDVVARGEEAGRAAAARMIETLLPRIGLLLDAGGARDLLAEITAWGLSPADPRLDMLHFNAALTENAT